MSPERDMGIKKKGLTVAGGSEQLPQQKRVEGGFSVSFKQLRKWHAIRPGLPQWDQQQRTGELRAWSFWKGEAMPSAAFIIYTKYPVTSCRNLQTHKLSLSQW